MTEQMDRRLAAETQGRRAEAKEIDAAMRALRAGELSLYMFPALTVAGVVGLHAIFGTNKDSRVAYVLSILGLCVVLFALASLLIGRRNLVTRNTRTVVLGSIVVVGGFAATSPTGGPLQAGLFIAILALCMALVYFLPVTNERARSHSPEGDAVSLFASVHQRRVGLALSDIDRIEEALLMQVLNSVDFSGDSSANGNGDYATAIEKLVEDKWLLREQATGLLPARALWIAAANYRGEVRKAALKMGPEWLNSSSRTDNN